MEIIEVETDSGVYKCKRPIGLMAIKHIGIITKYSTNNPIKDVDEKGNEVVRLSLKDQERFVEGFEIWAEKVLPHILKDFDSTNPHKYDEMPGEDMMRCYVTVATYTPDVSFHGE